MPRGLRTLHYGIELETDLGTEHKRLLPSSDLFVFSAPGLQDRGLECSAEGEGESPGFLPTGTIDSIQVLRGFQFRLPAGEEHNSYNCRKVVGKYRKINGKTFSSFRLYCT